MSCCCGHLPAVDVRGVDMFEPEAPGLKRFDWWRDVVVERGALMAVCDVTSAAFCGRTGRALGGCDSPLAGRTSLDDPQPYAQN